MLPFITELPPLEQDRIVCSISAAIKFEVPANIVLAVAEKEKGKPGQWVRNASNGTHDVGFMQFNTAYLHDLERYGITADDVATPGCYSFDLAAWRLRMHLKKDKGDIWTKAANFHSRTPKYNTVYRSDLIAKADKWAKWLETHFITTEIDSDSRVAPTEPAAAPAKLAEKKPVATSFKQAEHRVNSEYVPRQISFITPEKGGQ